MAEEGYRREHRIGDVYYGRTSDPVTRRIHRQRIHWLCEQARGERVLDVGCNQGIVSILLAREGFRCVAVDTGADLLAEARQALAEEGPAVRARVHLVLVDGITLPFADESFDTLIAGELLEHLIRPERFLDEARRVLRPGGRFVATTPMSFLDYHDHKRTFFLSSLLETVEGHFHTEYCEPVGDNDRHIAYLGSKRDPVRSLDDPQRVLHLLRRTEQAFFEREAALAAEVADLKDKWTKARDGMAELGPRYRDATRNYDRVRREIADRSRRLAVVERRLRQQTAALNSLEPVTRELQAARAELGAITHSRGYLMLERLRRFRREFLRGDMATRWAYTREVARKVVLRRAAPQPCLPDADYDTALDAFLERVARDSQSDRFVLYFTGTAYLQDWRGNRPIRITRVLRERGIPVLYSYYRVHPAEPIPPITDPLLFQSPLSMTVAHFDRILPHDYGGKMKLFFSSLAQLDYARWLHTIMLNGWITLHECRDNWEEFAKVGLCRWYSRPVEEYAVSHSDVTIATSQALVDKLQGYTRERTVHLSRNALDVKFLDPETRGRVAPRSGETIVGYFGILTEKWFDWPSLLEVARREPGWRFELIGYDAPTNLDLPPNVVLLGRKDHSEIKRIARRWRAGLIVRKINELTRAMDSIKVYEYLALGLPVVCFTMPQIESYPYVFSGRDAEEFREQLGKAMTAPLDRRVIDDFLAVNRWEDRLDQMMALVEQAAGEKSPVRALAGGGDNA